MNTTLEKCFSRLFQKYISRLHILHCYNAIMKRTKFDKKRNGVSIRKPTKTGIEH